MEEIRVMGKVWRRLNVPVVMVTVVLVVIGRKIHGDRGVLPEKNGPAAAAAAVVAATATAAFV